MKIAVSEKWPNRQEETEWFGRMALVLGATVLGAAALYFGALYLIAR
jgi:hypothetical protein